MWNNIIVPLSDGLPKKWVWKSYSSKIIERTVEIKDVSISPRFHILEGRNTFEFFSECFHALYTFTDISLRIIFISIVYVLISERISPPSCSLHDKYRNLLLVCDRHLVQCPTSTSDDDYGITWWDEYEFSSTSSLHTRAYHTVCELQHCSPDIRCLPIRDSHDQSSKRFCTASRTRRETVAVFLSSVHHDVSEFCYYFADIICEESNSLFISEICGRSHDTNLEFFHMKFGYC